MYHYTDSGLDNIHLVNGFHEKDTPYGRAVSIEDLNGLHKTIGQWLVNVAKPLNGAEFRFLRHELDLSQKKLGQMMGKSEQAIGRWERSGAKAVDPLADRFIRVIYSEWVDGNGPVKDLIERLADLDQLEHAECRLEEKDGRWRVADEAMAA
jgi:DNA-binding transcriptional regulator YiaG